MLGGNLTKTSGYRFTTLSCSGWTADRSHPPAAAQSKTHL